MGETDIEVGVNQLHQSNPGILSGCNSLKISIKRNLTAELLTFGFTKANRDFYLYYKCHPFPLIHWISSPEKEGTSRNSTSKW